MLPPNVTGIDFGELILEIKPDKIILIKKDKNSIHYTLPFGDKTGIIDIHKTWCDENGKPQHETIGAIRKETLAVILKVFMEEAGQSILQDFLSFLRPCRLGWLKHRNIGVVTGLFPTETDIPKITRKSRGGKRLKIDIKLLEQNITAPEYLNDIYDYPDETVFTLLKRRKNKWKQIGMLFKKTYSNGGQRLFWTKFGGEIKLLNKYESIILPIIKEYSLSDEEIKNLRQNINQYEANKT